MVWVKICGITRVEDARAAIELGADAVGVNLVPDSPRYVDLRAAQDIVAFARSRVEVIAVVADQAPAELKALRAKLNVTCFQMHGAESPDDVSELLPHAFKAVRISNPDDVDRASQFAGERLLLDAKVPGQLGGTGRTFDWELVLPLLKTRRVILAGGLNPENVGEAVAKLRPWGVDVASGVQEPGDPRRKSQELLRRFIRAAKSA